MNFLDKLFESRTIRRTTAQVFPRPFRRNLSPAEPCPRAIARAAVLEVLG